MTKLFPIHLLTPESMCNLFEAQDHVFDLVIFDEASAQIGGRRVMPLEGQLHRCLGRRTPNAASSYFASKRNVEDESTNRTLARKSTPSRSWTFVSS